MIRKTVSSLKLIVVLIAVNLVGSKVLFDIYTDHQQLYAQSINLKGNSIAFTKPINLTNNIRDSVYAQIASHGKNIFIVWQENNPNSFGGNSKYVNNIEYNYNNY